ncbi:MAG: [protein-PII] uridylyltransferase [Pseudomonadales bacterium]|nr:[protein-PII] uridylyltransferase [Pseudomonadales bacterium]
MTAAAKRFGDGPDALAESVRLRLAKKDAELEDRYWSRHNVEDLLTERTQAMDAAIAELWHACIPEKAARDLSLFAVGGYGRGEQFPHSDVDLLIVTRRSSRWQDEIRTFVHCLFDLKLEVGHSVRRLADCKAEAIRDITVATAMYERRHLQGSTKLARKLDRILASPRLWPPDKFFRAKRDEQLARHRQFDNVDYGLEPNIKASPGGLRDLQTALWIFQRQFGTQDMRDLEKIGALTAQERLWLIDGRRFLWWVRYGLHLLAGRKEDRLQFESQRALARRLGFADTEAKLGVERFMKLYYEHVLALREVNDIVLQYFDESILRGNEKPVVEPINERFRIRNNYIEVIREEIFDETPSAIMEIFVIMANRRDISGVRAQTIRAIRDRLHLIDDAFRSDADNTRLFLELLKAPYTLVSQLTRMRRYGVLGRYLPEYGQIIGQMQHDLFHIYTVDAHTMMVIRNMRRFHYRASEAEFPVACHCVRNLPKIELLYIAGLYHDIGKGRGGDHSALGARDVQAFCTRHGLNEDDTELVGWLVEKHLFMSSTAQRRDIYDPDEIQEFAREIKSERRLNYLYALTVADINATNPTLWNSWRASLMRHLYNETRKALRRGLESPVDRQATVRACQENALERLLDRGMQEIDVRAVWDILEDEFFFRHTPRQVADLTARIAAHDTAKPLVVIQDRRGPGSSDGATEICIYTPDRPGLFASTVAALSQLGLSVHEANIHTSSTGLCLNNFIVLDEQGDAPGERKKDREEIIAGLEQALSDTEEVPSLPRRRLSRQIRQLPTPTQVVIRNKPGANHTDLTVIAADRHGLLASIGILFAELGLSVQEARIATLGERVEDTFAVTDENGAPILSSERIYLLENTIRQRLDSQFANQL